MVCTVSGLWVQRKALLRAVPQEPRVSRTTVLCAFHPDEALPCNSSAWPTREDLQVRAGVGAFVSSWSESCRSCLITESW